MCVGVRYAVSVLVTIELMFPKGEGINPMSPDMPVEQQYLHEMARNIGWTEINPMFLNNSCHKGFVPVKT